MLHSARICDRFRRRLWLRRATAIIYLSTATVYLAWRLTIINDQALFLSGMYFVSDVIAVLLGALTIFVSWQYRHRRAPPAPEGLTVDVFIPTYREPIDMVRRTLAAAKAIRYAHETWLLDDGNRPAMRALAAELGCRYLTRAGNEGAKAGNLNHALSCSTADFVAVFDADHIPQIHALDATLGFFADDAVGMVQTPQDYYNTDAVQYMNPRRGGGLWHDQSFFYNLSQPGRDHYNAASCAGTGVVYRRSALEAIGGIPTETVTEDIHTSLKMQKAGYLVPYLNEPVAYGVAAADLTDYYRTRLRYGHGNIHALRHERILWCRGLTLRQRLSYLFLGLIYLEGWQQLMVFLVPTIALIFGVAPFQITILNVLIVLAYPLWSYLLMQEIGCGYSRYWTAEIYSMMRFPVHLLAAAGLVRNRMVWRTSQKNVRGRLRLNLLAPQIVVLVVSLVAVAVGFYRLDGHYTPGPLVAAIVYRVPDRQSIAEGYAAVSSWVATTTRPIVALVTPPEPTQPTSASGEASPSRPAASPTAPAATPEQAAPETVASRSKPPPINWLQPLNRGYTIDLVLIAGFWALFNALRVVFVIVKVARNARRTGSGYLFGTMTPIRIETSEGPRYVVAEKLSATTAVVVGALGGIDEEDLAAGLTATAYLPTGAAEIVLRPQDGWISRPHARTATFHLECPSEAGRTILEDGLYATSWHRECHNNDAEFTTPLGALARLFGRGHRRSPWRAALVVDDDRGRADVALLGRTGELLVLADAQPQAGVARVVVMDRNGWETRHLLLGRLLASEPFYASVPQSSKLYRYQTEASATPDNVAVLPRRVARRLALAAVPTRTPAAAGESGDRASA
jgi:cellulose synthase/poly-beta-1,6-N-acetylglucosamine synthase-like glycosyltransferase